MLGNLGQVVTRVCARSCGKLKIVYKGAQSGKREGKVLHLLVRVDFHPKMSGIERRNQ